MEKILQQLEDGLSVFPISPVAIASFTVVHSYQ
jgi:hypothetical protein